MAIWNMIRDFLVQYIFGGVTSNGDTFTGVVGDNLDTSNVSFEIGNNTINMGDWLSTTTTIIILCIFVIILFLLLKWLFKTISGLILLK